MGKSQIIAGVQKVKKGLGHIALFPKGLRLCIIGLIVPVAIEIQAGPLDFLVV